MVYIFGVLHCASAMDKAWENTEIEEIRKKMGINWNITKGVLFIIIAILYLSIFRKSAKYIKKNDHEDDFYPNLKKASDFNDYIMFWGSRIAMVLLLIIGLYLIYSEFFD